VRLRGGRIPFLPVKTQRSVPREAAREVVGAAGRVLVEAPVSLGDVVLRDAAGTGVDLVATRSVEAAGPAEMTEAGPQPAGTGVRHDT
jgi:CxxC motif-containing protein